MEFATPAELAKNPHYEFGLALPMKQVFGLTNYLALGLDCEADLYPDSADGVWPHVHFDRTGWTYSQPTHIEKEKAALCFHCDESGKPFVRDFGEALLVTSLFESFLEGLRVASLLDHAEYGGSPSITGTFSLDDCRPVFGFDRRKGWSGHYSGMSLDPIRMAEDRARSVAEAWDSLEHQIVAYVGHYSGRLQAVANELKFRADLAANRPWAIALRDSRVPLPSEHMSIGTGPGKDINVAVLLADHAEHAGASQPQYQ